MSKLFKHEAASIDIALPRAADAISCSALHASWPGAKHV